MRVTLPAASRVTPWPRRVSTIRAGASGAYPVGDEVGRATGTVVTPVAAALSIVKLQLTLREAVLTPALYVPCARGLRGTTITALSPLRICWATPVVLADDNTQTSIGCPSGPISAAAGLVAASGIIAISGRPAAPVQPQ